MSEWQPIKTAPKDGLLVLVHARETRVSALVAGFWDGKWREPANALALRNPPTHWMPLPNPPENPND